MSGEKRGHGAPTPQQLTGGVGHTSQGEKASKTALRALPKVKFAEPSPNYCKLVAHGWDTFTETYNCTIPAAKQEWLAEFRDKAEKGEGVVALQLGDETLQMLPHGGKGGVRWILQNDDFSISIRSPKLPWPLTVRYSAGGLWGHGLRALQDRVYHALRAEFHPGDDQNVRVGACHYAFDFHSPAFTAEMRPRIAEQIVCHSSAKNNMTVAVPAQLIGTSARTQTLTMGGKAGLQVQVYDKTTEITEASGKTWMIDLWLENGAEFPDGDIADVWRLELRFGGEFLKERGILYPREIERFLPELITEAIVTRRLTEPSNDSNRWRWPVHPLWTAAYRQRAADAMRPLGRRLTMTREALITQAKAQLAGGLRSLTVLTDVEGFDNDTAESLALQLPEIINADPNHAAKVDKAAERYRFVDEMK